MKTVTFRIELAKVMWRNGMQHAKYDWSVTWMSQGYCPLLPLIVFTCLIKLLPSLLCDRSVWHEVHRFNEGEPVNITEGHVIIQ
jgi:hypothetical protein